MATQEDIQKELCMSYRAIDDFRGKLLGFLPLATGGLFLLSGEHGQRILNSPILALPLGLFGLFITLGLFIFEIYGIRRCTHLIILGRHLEKELIIEGQFLHRPKGVEGFLSANFSQRISEPMASGVIYPAVGAAWAYLSVQSLTYWLAALLAIAIFALGFRFTYKYSKWLADVDWPKEEGKLEKMRESKGAIQTKPSGKNP